MITKEGWGFVLVGRLVRVLVGWFGIWLVCWLVVCLVGNILQAMSLFVSNDEVNGLVDNISKTPVIWSCPAGGSRVALPHIHLDPDYPGIPINQLCSPM